MTVDLPRGRKHGTGWAYRFGCKCDECRDWNRRRAYGERTPSPDGKTIGACGMLRMTNTEHMPWTDQALCQGCDPALFFPTRGESSGPAKLVCFDCPVKARCLWAGMHEKHGVWGGKSERQRRAMRTDPTAMLMVQLAAELEEHVEAVA